MCGAYPRGFPWGLVVGSGGGGYSTYGLGFPKWGPLVVVRKEVWRGLAAAFGQGLPVPWGGVSEGVGSGDPRTVILVVGSGRRVFVPQ